MGKVVTIFDVSNTKTKADILKFLIGHPKERFYGKQLADKLNTTPAMISVVIAELVGTKIITCDKIGQMRFYSINDAVLKEILTKTVKESGST
ncbi:MAG: helix-turn-helix domain-containing protein [Candidatus Aenigmarchaeota archaeon]|nr:helix-turn-helix domain-containing protein [Candidatus Aenigmarchaeota archaeon]